ncbi:protein PHR1-LIKE 2-like isoform X1 [Senna tora]|uniref:Protein PHR1-LIKE 2-like isoform X1 n=1 Tax=Senna tora TaxID=362788 RepID=A0A834WKG6_9FABA|nr:protein PHR1-LIKE 2-like isoform X1 [Senna tora]
MRTMNVKGLTLYHLKSHLQKYRLGKQSGKDFDEGCKDGISASYLLESPRTGNSSPKLPAADANEGLEVKEALRAQMEVQSKLHLLVEAEKHLQIRQDAERRYMAMLERACKMLADQLIGVEVIEDTDNQKFEGQGSKASRSSMVDSHGFCPLPSEVGELHVSEEVAPSFHNQRADCSSESCLTSHESVGGLGVEGSAGGGKRKEMSLDSVIAPLMWSEANMRTQGIHLAHGNNPHGIPRGVKKPEEVVLGKEMADRDSAWFNSEDLEGRKVWVPSRSVLMAYSQCLDFGSIITQQRNSIGPCAFKLMAVIHSISVVHFMAHNCFFPCFLHSNYSVTLLLASLTFCFRSHHLHDNIIIP